MGRMKTASGNVPNANWNPDDRQFNLNANDAGNSNDNLAPRPAVRTRTLGH